MSKELTEKFMNDELDDRLYYFTQKMSQDNVEIGRSFAFNMVRADDGEYLDWFLIHEVLDPVPTYQEWLESESHCAVYSEVNEWNKDKIKKLEQQLEEANKIIKKLYKESGNPIGCDYIEKWCVE